jgi:hypothetical protein
VWIVAKSAHVAKRKFGARRPAGMLESGWRPGTPKHQFLGLTAFTTELEQRDARHALCTMCVGVGQGMAAIIEKV